MGFSLRLTLPASRPFWAAQAKSTIFLIGTLNFSQFLANHRKQTTAPHSNRDKFRPFSAPLSPQPTISCILDPSVQGIRHLRDAIVLSGWNWETFNVPERIALAFAHLGAKVLYCENPVSRFRARGRPMEEIENGIHRLRPEFLGHRFNRIPLGFPQLQARIVAIQVIRRATALGLEKPLVVYPHGEFFVPLRLEFKRRGFSLVHICMDYPEPGQNLLIEMSDLTLVIPKSVYHELHAKYGDKIALIPQATRRPYPRCQIAGDARATEEFAAIPRPRLGYIGPVANRLNLRVLEELLKAQPDWQFVHIGAAKCLPLPNVHVISWRPPEKLKDVIANLDVGFMPYDCSSNRDFHCMPLKVFDYFSAGLPVISTPIVNLREYSDTIYFGNDAGELAQAVQSALDEPADSQRKPRRIGIAQEHSIEELSKILKQVLPL